MATLYVCLVIVFFVTNISDEVIGIGCCPDGWTSYRESCYYFTHNTNMSFVESEHFCRQHSAHLVHVNDAEENAFLKDHLQRLIPDHYWMGLSDEGIEGIFKWQDTNTVPTFTDWSPGQPDDHGTRHDEDCVVFWMGHGFLWNDAGCGYKTQAVCEMGENIVERLQQMDVSTAKNPGRAYTSLTVEINTT